MTTVGQASEKKDYPRFELNGSGKLIISKVLQGQIDYLHDKVGSFEWIGVLLYTKEEGSIADPNSLVLKAHKLFLMDIGTSGHTQAKLDAESVLDMYDKVPDVMELKQGLIHTHHNMETFFSGEDWSELNDNTINHNYYLSLIVNFKGTYQAKVALMADMSTIFDYNDCDDLPIQSRTDKKVLMTFNMNIVKEGTEVDEEFENRYLELKEIKNKPTIYVHPLYSQPVGGYGHLLPKKPDQGEVDQKEKTFRREDKHYTRNQNNTLTYNQARDLGLTWLNEGRKLVMDKENTYEYQNVVEGLASLEDHYKGKFGTDEFKAFLSLMQVLLVEITADYKPSVTSKRISVLFSDLKYGSSIAVMASALSQLALRHPEFLANERKKDKHELTALELAWGMESSPTFAEWQSMAEKEPERCEYDEDMGQWRLM